MENKESNKFVPRLDATIVERFNDYELVLINGGKGGLLGFVKKILGGSNGTCNTNSSCTTNSGNCVQGCACK